MTTTPSTASASMRQPEDKRRVSDQGAVRPASETESQRRRTVAGEVKGVSWQDESPPPAFTPSKSKSHVNLGSAAASAYYFSDMPKTPLTAALSAKKKKLNSSVRKESVRDANESMEAALETTGDYSATLADTSVLSMGTTSSSSEEGDVLNKSVLSDTTELTASNFVLAASSRQRLFELSRSQSNQDHQESTLSQKENEENNPQDAPAEAHREIITVKSTKPDDGERDRAPLKTLNGGDDAASGSDDITGTPPVQDSIETRNKAKRGNIRDDRTSTSDVTVHGRSPSMRSRINADPSSARKLTESLRKSRLKREKEMLVELSGKRLSIGSSASPIARRSSVGTVGTIEEEVSVGHSKTRRMPVGRIPIVLPPLTPASDLVKPSKDPSPPTNETKNEDLDVSSRSLEDLFAGLVDSDSEDESKDMSPGSSKTSQPPQDHSSGDKQQASETCSDTGVTSPSAPMSTYASVGSPFRGTRHSHKKPTPSKLSPSPRRIVNPKAIDSPARNTRSARKAAQSPTPTKSPSLGPSQPSLDGEHDERRETADTLMLAELMVDMKQMDKEGTSPSKQNGGSLVSKPSRASSAADSDMLRDLMTDVDAVSAPTDAETKRKREEDQLGTSVDASAVDTIQQTEVSVAPESKRTSISKRRRSSISVVPLPEKERASVESTLTANTADINNLLASNDELVSTGLTEEQGEAGGTTIEGATKVLSPVPGEQRYPPKSILSSTCKRKSDETAEETNKRNSLLRKKVAFGSPEAAEYNLGSPSVSLTPMPNHEAKAMFVMPSTQSKESGLSPDSSTASSIVAGENTMEIEADMNALLRNNSAGSSAGVPENPSRDLAAHSSCEPLRKMDGAVGDKDMPAFNERTSTPVNRSSSQETSSPESAKAELSPSSSIDASGTAGENEDATVELETDLTDLLANTCGSPAVSTTGTSNRGNFPSAGDSDDMLVDSVSPTDSIEMADAASLMSVNASAAKHAEGDTDSFVVGGQKLNFDGPTGSNKTEDSDSSKNIGLDTSAETRSMSAFSVVDAKSGLLNSPEEENTVELDVDMSTLLATTGNQGHSFAQDSLTTSSASRKNRASMVGNLAPRTNRMSFGEGVHEDNDKSFTGTVDLEPNMESLLQTAGENDDEAFEGMVLSDSPSTVGSVKNGRPSIGSRRRFSLAPESRLSLSMDGSVLIDEWSAGKDEGHAEDSVVSCRKPTGLNDATSPPSQENTETIDLTSAEITESATLSADWEDVALESVPLLGLDNVSDTLQNPSIADAVNGFLSAVCSEVEGKAESSSDGELCFSAIVDNSPDHVLCLQRALRSGDTSDFTSEQLKSLATAARDFVLNEWKVWETQVADALNDTIPGISDDFEEDDRTIERFTTLVDDTHETIALMAGRAVRKARRRSMDRRKTAASLVEDEIRELEAQIEQSTTALEAMRSEEASAGSMKGALRDLAALGEALISTRATAESRHDSFMSLGGLHSWMPVEIEESKVAFAFIGSNPKTCMVLSFSLSKSNPVGCKAYIDPSYFRHRKQGKHSTGKRTTSATAFIEAHMTSIVKSVNKTVVSAPEDIGSLLQQLGWVLGRLEMNTSELCTLQRRYVTTLEADPMSHVADFLFSVEFASHRETAKLRATFQLHYSYPFTPLDVCLETIIGNIDVEALRKQLIKNAKPGFGYLSRTCDVISAFVR